MKDMLSLSEHLPLVRYAPGDIIVQEGGLAGGIWVLASGSLDVTKNGMTVNTVTEPGALIGEISVLLEGAYSATVTASAPSALRYAADGRAFLSANPEIMQLVATGLASRLEFVTTYLADLKHQYGDAPGLSMVPEVLRKLSQRQRVIVRPGSSRDPDPEY